MEQIKIIRLEAVKEKTGVSRSFIYASIAEGTFPRQISLGSRSVGWLESEILNWISNRVQISRKGV